MMREEKEMKEIEECKFTPQLLTKRKADLNNIAG
jgi:hypothetical protein